MQTRYQYLLRIFIGVTDLILVNFAFFATSYFIDIIPNEAGETYAHYFVTSNLIWLFSASLFGLFRLETAGNAELIYRATWKSFLFHMVLFLFYVAFAKDAEFSHKFILYFYSLLCGGFLLSRFMITVLEALFERSNVKQRKSVAILGITSTSEKLASYFKGNKSNFIFKGFLKEDDNNVYIDEAGEMVNAATEQIRTAANHGVNEVYVSMTSELMAEAPSLITEAEKQCIRLKFVPDLSGSLPSSFSVNYVGSFPIVNLRNEPLEFIENRVKKRIVDIIISLFAIVFVISWLYPIMALLIKLQSRGPVLFRQARSGRDNKPFKCYKFRSMRLNNDSDTARQATKHDERITPIGRFMRRTSIDEIPQFFNVLLGNMSIVGPRPHPIKLNETYTHLISSYMVRHLLKPGITGWAQVNGYRGETKSPELMEARVEHDIWYMENWSVMLDVKIIFLTFVNVLKGQENAY